MRGASKQWNIVGCLGNDYQFQEPGSRPVIVAVHMGMNEHEMGMNEHEMGMNEHEIRETITSGCATAGPIGHLCGAGTDCDSILAILRELLQECRVHSAGANGQLPWHAAVPRCRKTARGREEPMAGAEVDQAIIDTLNEVLTGEITAVNQAAEPPHHAGG